MKPIFVLDFAEIRQHSVDRPRKRDLSVRMLLNGLGSSEPHALDGFAVTTDAYSRLLATDHLAARLQQILAGLDVHNPSDLARRGREARAAVLDTALPDDLRGIILSGYQRLHHRRGGHPVLAVYADPAKELVRTSESDDHAETFFVHGPHSLLRAVHHCYASMFTDDAIAARAALGCAQLSVGLSIGIIPRTNWTRLLAA